MTVEEAIKHGIEWRNMLSPYLDRQLSAENKASVSKDIEFLDMALVALRHTAGSVTINELRSSMNLEPVDTQDCIYRKYLWCESCASNDFCDKRGSKNNE